MVARLEAEFERNAAKDQAQQHEDQWQIQGRQQDRIRERERGQQTGTTEHQPGLVAVPDRGDSVHHDIAFITIGHEWKQDADPQIEAIHDDVHKNAEEDNHGPNDRKIDTHLD